MHAGQPVRDLTDIMDMPKTFTVDLYKPKMGVTETEPGYLMAHDDDALHYREKSLMQGLLNRDDLPRIRALVAKTGKKILDDAGGQIEIVKRLLPHGAGASGAEIFRSRRRGPEGPDRVVVLEPVRRISQPAVRPQAARAIPVHRQEAWRGDRQAGLLHRDI